MSDVDDLTDAVLTALADLLEVNPPTAKRMIDRLITFGMVDREPNPGHQTRGRGRRERRGPPACRSTCGTAWSRR